MKWIQRQGFEFHPSEKSRKDAQSVLKKEGIITASIPFGESPKKFEKKKEKLA
jgi:hypothetical protein